MSQLMCKESKCADASIPFINVIALLYQSKAKYLLEGSSYSVKHVMSDSLYGELSLRQMET